MKALLLLLPLATVFTTVPDATQADTSTNAVVRIPEYQAGLRDGQAYKNTHTAAQNQARAIYAQERSDEAYAAGDVQTYAYWDGYVFGLGY